MLKKIFKNDIFTKNIGWKIFSLILASLMWIVVMTTQTPYEYKTFTTNLSIINIDTLEKNGLVVLNQKELEQTRIQIKVYAQRPALAELSNLENRKLISASLNVENFDILYAKDISEPITASITPYVPTPLQNYDIDVVVVTPNTIRVRLDRLVSETKEITVDRIGEPIKGYVAMQPVVTPESIVITGAETQIKKISSVRVSVDLTNADKNVVSKVSPVIYDEYNNKLSSLSISSQEVEVLTVINKQSELPLEEPALIGSVASGYQLLSVDWEPKTVSVVGSEEDLNLMQSVVLPNINIDNLSETTTFSYDLRQFLLNTSLNIVNGKPTEAAVTITVGKTNENTYTIGRDQIAIEGLSDSTKIYLPEFISFTLTGLDSDFENFNIQSVNPRIDVSSLNLGTRVVPVDLTLPEGISLKSPIEITVLITDSYTETE